jgi:hypothetical protein
MSNSEEKREIDEYNESYGVKPQYTEEEKNEDLEDTETEETIEYRKTKKGKIDGRSKRKGGERTEAQKKAFENMIQKKKEKAKQKAENKIKEKAIEEYKENTIIKKSKPKKKPVYKEIITHEEETESDEETAPIVIRKVIKKPRKIKVLDTGGNDVEVEPNNLPSKPINIPKQLPHKEYDENPQDYPKPPPRQQYKMSKYEYMRSLGF